MYRANSDYHHKPYKNQINGSDVFYICAKTYIIIVTIAYFSIWFTRQPFFQLTDIHIEGAHSIPSEEVREIASSELKVKKLYFWKVDNAILYPSKSIENELKKKYPRLISANVSLTRKNIYINISEYEPNMRYCLSLLDRENSSQLVLPQNLEMGSFTSTSTLDILSGESILEVDTKNELGLKEIPVKENIEGDSSDCYWADNKGYVFGTAPSYIGSPLLTIVEKIPEKSSTLSNDNSPIGKTILNEISLKNLKEIILLLKDSGLDVKQVSTISNNDVTIDIGYQFIIIMNLDKNPEESVDHLLLVLKELGVSSPYAETKVKYIDVRFKNKVFYR